MSAEEPEREFEEFLRRIPREKPSSSVRKNVRSAFLSPGDGADRSRLDVGERSGDGMPLGPQNADERGFADWLASTPLAPSLPADRLQRARLTFLSAVAGGVPKEPSSRRNHRLVRRLVPALAAAAILAVTFLLPKPERWKARLEGPLRFAEREYDSGQSERLAADLEASGTLETGAEGARFELGDGLVIEVLAEATFTFPTLPELDGTTPLTFELARGEAYVSTTPSYPGNPISIRTAMADVTLHGTTVGVLVDDLGTCVCVADGVARVSAPSLPEDRQDIGPRASLLVWGDPSRTPELEPFPEEGTGAATEHTEDLVGFMLGRGR